MKTTILILILIPIFGFAQKKDLTVKQLLKNKRVIEFSNENETKPIKTIEFLKCIKKESNSKTFIDLPFFTGELPLIVNEKIKNHNSELWEAIHEDCKNKTIFIKS